MICVLYNNHSGPSTRYERNYKCIQSCNVDLSQISCFNFFFFYIEKSIFVVDVCGVYLRLKKKINYNNKNKIRLRKR